MNHRRNKHNNKAPEAPTETKSSMPTNTSTQRHPQLETQENRIISSSIGRTYYEEYMRTIYSPQRHI